MQQRNELVTVRKSNYLIESIGNATLLSQKVLLTSLLRLEDRKGDYSEEEKKYYQFLQNKTGTDYTHGIVAEIKNCELRENMGSTSGSYYDKIRELMDPDSPNSLKAQWRILIKDPKNQLYGSTDIITSTVYDQKNGKMFIKFSSEPSVRNNLLELKGNYSLLPYHQMMKFKSLYSYRIYELLLDRIGKEDGRNHSQRSEYVFEYNLSELKYLIGVLNGMITTDVKNALAGNYPDYEAIEEHISPENTMVKYSDFRKYALEKAKKEINEKTPLSIDYAPVRNGRGGKVVGVQFTVKRKDFAEAFSPKKQALTSRQMDEVMDEVMQLIKEPLRLTDIRAICEAAEYDIEKIDRAYALAKAQRTGITNLAGFLVSAIKNNYNAPVRMNAKNGFSDFKQNEYDFSEIEKQIVVN